MNKKVLISSFLIIVCAFFIRFSDSKGTSVMTFSGGGDFKKSVTLEDFANNLYLKNVSDN
ncbi:MAG: hypothetical protein E7621_00395 [Ruminococcaceae bacterium]|nr:hypothetical protein [Oscillospiraceae bacterium]